MSDDLELPPLEDLPLTLPADPARPAATPAAMRPAGTPR